MVIRERFRDWGFEIIKTPSKFSYVDYLRTFNTIEEYVANLSKRVELSNPCHAPDSGEFCEVHGSGEWRKALKNKTDHIPDTTQKYWLDTDGGFVPVDFHGQVLTERKGTENPYVVFTDKTRAVRIDSSPHDASIELFRPATEDQISAILSELKRPKVYIASNSATLGFGQTTLENPTRVEMERALNTANNHLRGNTHTPKSADFLSIEGNWSFANHPDARVKIEASTSVETEILAAGIAVQANDTGRLLLLQRSLSDQDPASGKWEFPGGTLDLNETPISAAIREFQEETGLKLPQGEYAGQWISPNGVYKGFVYRIKEESNLQINLDHEDRKVLNPDDPDGDNIETLAWWDPKDLPTNPALREEVRDTDWQIFTPKFSSPPSTEFLSLKNDIAKRVTSTLSRITEFYNKCHDDETGQFCEDPHHKDASGKPAKVRIEKASPEEHKAAKAKAKAWIRIAPVPSAADVKRGRNEAIKAKRGESHGGSPEQIAQQRQNLFEEFGGRKRGYVIDPQSGIKMHWTSDPKENPNQYPIFTRGRIFTSAQGGRYILANLIPESFPSNRARGNRPVRKENQT